jgi:hypothetical protein
MNPDRRVRTTEIRRDLQAICFRVLLNTCGSCGEGSVCSRIKLFRKCNHSEPCRSPTFSLVKPLASKRRYSAVSALSTTAASICSTCARPSEASLCPCTRTALGFEYSPRSVGESSVPGVRRRRHGSEPQFEMLSSVLAGYVYHYAWRLGTETQQTDRRNKVWR